MKVLQTSETGFLGSRLNLLKVKQQVSVSQLSGRRLATILLIPVHQYSAIWFEQVCTANMVAAAAAVEGSTIS